MELTELLIRGTQVMRVENIVAARPNGEAMPTRQAWLSRLPSVEPGSLSMAYRSFRAQEAMTNLPVMQSVPASDSGAAILSGSVPAALAAYGEFDKE